MHPSDVLFQKNLFKFLDLDPSCKVHIKIGLFQEADPEGEGSIVLASGSFKEDLGQWEAQRPLAGTCCQTVVLTDLQDREEFGQCYFEIKLRITDFV